jgi:hypothetical protein
MPLLATPPAGPIATVIPAAPGCTATLGPVSGPVVAWALVANPGDARLDPVFIAGGRTWTPDQYRAATGNSAPVIVTAR